MEGLVNAEAWRGRRVLVTGHTGFKGAWLKLWLEHTGATVSGLALEPPSTPSLHALVASPDDSDALVDVRAAPAVATRLQEAEPDVVFHLAAQSLVRASYADPLATYAVNVLGTANVLDAVRICPSVRAVVVVTSDKVYEPDRNGSPHTEDSPLGGADPYSSSKAGAELVSASY